MSVIIGWVPLNISELASKYYTLYKRDLHSDILNDLSEKEKATLYRIIEELPNR